MNLIQVHNDWFFGNVTLHIVDGNIIQLSSLKVKEGYTSRHILVQKLVSEFEICFHGFGGGAERMSTVDGLFADQCWISNNMSLFYNAVHNKQSSVRSPSKNPVKHKSPPSIVPLFLLFRQICLSINSATSNEVIPSLPGRTFTMKNALCSHFQIDSKIVSALDIRHLYTTITNIIYNEHSNENEFLASLYGAQLNNHSHAIHHQHYSTVRIGSHERMIDAYHSFLGETMHNSDRNFSISMEPITATQQQRALQCIFGQLSMAHDDDQKQMIDLSCNSNNKHKFIGLRCGLGKSLSILVPIVNEKLSRRGSRCRILVNPYGFLNDSAYEAFKSRLAKFSNELSLESYCAIDINENQVPDHLLGDYPPDILLLTIEAASNLVKYHPLILRKWKEQDLLHGIWLDEVQCLLDEYDFRVVYQQLPLLASIGVPVTVMSGSFPRNMVYSLMKFLNLIPAAQSNLTTIDQVHSNDIIGCGFHFEVLMVRDAIQETIEMIKKFHTDTGKAVHVMCASKKDCIEFGKRMKDDATVCIVHGDMPKQDQTEVAKKWYSSEISILFSTTIGMVGNENKEMAGLYCVGLPYCLSNLVQILGRFRPNQRHPPAMFRMIITSRDLQQDQWQTSQADDRRNQLLYSGIINEGDILLYNDVFHIDGLKRFFMQQGCYLVRMRKLFSSSNFNSLCCSECTWCCKSLKYIVTGTMDQFSTTPNTPTPIQCNKNVSNHTSSCSHTVMNPYKKQRCQLQSTKPSSSEISHTMASKHLSTTSSPMATTVATSCNKEQEYINVKDRAHRILSWLKTYCPRCKVAGCEGTCHNSCLICGERGHRMNTCNFSFRKQAGKDLETFLKNKRVCNWCYGLIGNGEMHGVEKGQTTKESRCTLKRRLKCAINLKRSKCIESHGVHLRKIYSSEQSFYSYVCKLDIDIMAPTR